MNGNAGLLADRSPAGRVRRRRRGALLLQVSFLLLALMGLLAVVIDLGIARATQNFLQASADAASMEGLRLRNSIPGAPVQSDLARRSSAARAAALCFDEDLDLGTGANDYLLGAGPQLATGVAGVDDPTGGLLVDQGPYLPQLELNSATNAPHGDLVAGTFVPTDPLDPGNPDWHAEDALYQRQDFQPAVAANSPSAPAFLARLRRTNDDEGLDNVAGVSSSGPTLPFLFGLGSGALTTNDPAAYDPRRDGITLRATSIADSRPAVAVGVLTALVNGLVPVGADAANPGVPRVLSFGDASWQTDLVVGSTFQIVVTRDGTVQGVAGGPTPSVSGFVQPAPNLVRVGDAATVAPTPLSVLFPGVAPAIEGTHYVALYDPPTPGAARIVGFAAVRIDTVSATPSLNGTGTESITLTGVKLASLVAPENASAQPSLAADLSVQPLPSPLREPLLAPVLAR